MKKYLVKIEYEREVEASNPDEVRGKFWEDWGHECRMIVVELS